MKKTLIALAALAMVAACNKAEVVEINNQAITFGQAFVDNATKAIDPSFGESNLIKEFNVWGTVTGNSGNSINLYNGASVYDEEPTYGVAYACEQTEYWIPSATYNFVAIANATSVSPATGMPTSISYTADGVKDLLYTKVGTTVTTDASATPSQNLVAFTFNHLLSKVHFNFTNASGNDKCIFKIKDIKIASGHFASGTYTIANNTWGGTTAATEALSFGNGTNATDKAAEAAEITNGNSVTSNNAKLIIPGAQTLTVSFTKEFYYDADGAGSASFPVLMKTETVSSPLVVANGTAAAYTFTANGSYVINVELTAGLEITFTVNKCENWDNDTTISIP